MSKSFLSLFTKERSIANRSCRSLQKSVRERIVPVALYKKVIVSNLLPLLITKKGRERFALFHEGIALSLTKNERFARNTDKGIPNHGGIINGVERGGELC